MDLHANLVTPRRLWLEHAFILGEAEVEGRGLERVPIIREQTRVVQARFPKSEHPAHAAAQPGMRDFQAFAALLGGRVQAKAAVEAES